MSHDKTNVNRFSLIQQASFAEAAVTEDLLLIDWITCDAEPGTAVLDFESRKNHGQIDLMI